jgi:hypothetical protein
MDDLTQQYDPESGTTDSRKRKCILTPIGTQKESPGIQFLLLLFLTITDQLEFNIDDGIFCFGREIAKSVFSTNLLTSSVFIRREM